MLPASTPGILAYADYGASYTNTANSLWIPLIEKAYAQWNQTGKEGRDGTNAFASIQGGWMATVDAQVLGYNATDYIMTTTSEQVAINALAANEGGDDRDPECLGHHDGLYANHAYAIIGYNAATDTFTLYNPWGDVPAGAAHLEPAPGRLHPMAVADTSGSVPISGVPGKVSSTVKASLSDGVFAFDGTAALHSDPAAAVFSRSDRAQASLPSGQFSATARASRQLFEALENSSTLRSHPTHTSDPLDGALSASLVDAMFAADGLLV